MDNNNYETEEQMKERIRKEILDELNGNSNSRISNENEVRSYGPPKKVSKVNFSKEKVLEKPIKEVVEDTKVDNGGKSSNVMMIICLLVIVVGVALFPTISSKLTDIKNSQRKPTVKIEEEPEKVYEKLTLDSEEIKEIKYPTMHVDNSLKTTYLSKDEVTVSDFSNNDILYNALIDVGIQNINVYKGQYNGTYCGGNSNNVSITDMDIKLRINNKFNTKTKYDFKDIIVPLNSTKTNLVGTWKYDSVNNIYVYYGDCNTSRSNILYFDINVPYDVDNSDKNIEAYVYNYIVFAQVNTQSKEYIIYSDSNYTNEISRGTLTSNKYESELTTILSSMNKDNVKKYKYTFSIVDCSYQDYCFIKGEWVK